jgi:tRNA pseudouridine55 synthase
MHDPQPEKAAGATGQVILVNKPLGWTSFDVVRKVRNVLSQGAPGERRSRVKVGHAGTLDPLASGLLVVCTGAWTRRIAEIQGAEKEYTGTLTLGASRPSYDMETEIDQVYEYHHITPEDVHRAALSFTGEIWQVPPAHSAVKIGGVRAYQKARKGHEVEIQPKRVLITEFEITGIVLPDVSFRVVCSKGTYIRSLASDFGKHLQSGAYLSALCRTRIGSYRLEDAVDPRNMNNPLITG